MGRDRYGIWFRSPTPVVFQMYPVVTLEELKSVILRNMGLGVVGMSLVRRVAYRLLNVFPPDPFKFKIFCVDSDEHVRALFDLHRRYGTREVMELLTEIQSMPEVVGGSSSSNGVIPYSSHPLSGAGSAYADGCTAPIPDLSSVNSHFHTLHLEDMDEMPMEGFGGGGDYYDVDGGEEFRVGPRFSKREAVHLGVKNYNIRRASEYRVVESDPYKKRNPNQGASDVILAVEPRQTLYSLWGSHSRCALACFLGRFGSRLCSCGSSGASPRSHSITQY
ncbi:hypothetical protein PIB30_000289 [Stylosanthes scabra]|uniref:Uncharacterized protein n=1 Tax=Stylosanthes scabra TaxID=79078 RepID=A0ABU6T2I9_9FABA|nr:hypothetical protein [Stylosanthes scabra]